MGSLPEPVCCRRSAYEALAHEVARLDQPGALLRAATAIAMHELKEADPRLVDVQLESWAGQVRSRLQGRSARAVMAHVDTLLFEELGFVGDAEDYYNPFNSYLPLVLERRRGIPITLSLVYCELMWRLGVKAEGLNTPGHFLVMVVDPSSGTRTCLDPFHQGRVMDIDDVSLLIAQATGELIETDPEQVIATPRVWLMRMLANLEGVFMQSARSDDATAMREMAGLVG